MNNNINCRTPDFPNLPSPANDWETWKALYSRGRLVVCLVVTLATVLMLLWPLKMLKLSCPSFGPSVCRWGDLRIGGWGILGYLGLSWGIFGDLGGTWR